MRIHDALADLPIGALRRLAEHHGVSDAADPSSTAVELGTAIAARFADRDHLALILAGLTDAERGALATARAGGGEIGGYLLAERLASTDPDAARNLLDHGLLVRAFAALGPHKGEVFALPEEVAGCLTDFPVGRVEAVLPGSRPAPQRSDRRTSDPAFSVFALASFLLRHPSAELALAGTRAAALQGEVEHWAREPGGWGWQERWTFLASIGQAAGVVATAPEQTANRWHAAARRYGNRELLATRLWRTYRRFHGEWSELEHAQTPYGVALAEQVDAPALRERLLALVAHLPADTWFDIEEIAAWAEAVDPNLLRDQLDARALPVLGVETLQGGPSAVWPRLEAPLLRYVLLGPLYWLGAVATDAAGERVALTPTGRSLLHEPAPEPPPARPVEPCTWELAAMEIPAPGPASLPDRPGAKTPPPLLLASARADLTTLLRAERYLVLVERAQVSRYCLERFRVAEAMASEGSIAECRTLLLRLGGGTLPELVMDQLDEWGERTGAIALRPTVLLEARDPADLARLRAEDAFREFFRSEADLGPGVAEVPASKVPAFTEALRAAGYFPEVDAALRLMAGRRAYSSLVDEQVLEFLFASLLAFRAVAPDQVAALEGAPSLLERLESIFPPEHRTRITEAANHLAAALRGATGLPSSAPRRRASAARRGAHRGQRGSVP